MMSQLHFTTVRAVLPPTPGLGLRSDDLGVPFKYASVGHITIFEARRARFSRTTRLDRQNAHKVCAGREIFTLRGPLR